MNWLKLYFFTAILLLSLPALAQSDKIIKVGVVAPLTGPIAVVGESMRNAITLENEKAPLSPKLEFIFEDDQFDPKLTVAAVRKFIEFEKVQAILTFGSGPSLASGSLAEQAGIPMLALAFSEKVVENKTFVFRMSQTAKQQAALIAKEIEARGYDSIALLSATNEANIVVRDAFKAVNKAKILLEEEVAPNDFNLGMVAAKILQAKPKAVSLFVLGPQIPVISRRLREAGYKGDFFASSTLQNQEQINAANGSLDGSWLSALDTTKAQDYLDEYQKRFGSVATPDGSLAYDAVALIRYAASTGDISKAIRETNSFDGIFGHHQKVSTNSFDSPVVIKQIEKGQIVPR